MTAMNISEQGIALIKSFEGCRLTAYKAVNTEKYYTIGWGHYGADVKAGQTISQGEADALLLSDLQRFVKYTNTYTACLNLNQDQFDALVSFCYNCGPGTLKKLVAGRTLDEIAEHITDYTKSGGKILKGLERRRQQEKEMFCKGSEVGSMSIILGSARIDERGKASGGAAGDQKQTSSVNDVSGEVSMQAMYMHSKGWYISRPKDVIHAAHMAALMKAACNNANIGYNQGNRLGVIQHGITTAVKTECDCSSLVREVVREATGKDPGNFTTANEVSVLEASGLFEKRITYVSQEKTPVYNGDVLTTKTKGHTVIVVSGNARPGVVSSESTAVSMAKVEAAKSFDKGLAGAYKTTGDLHLRAGAGKEKESLVIMPKGTIVRSYGYYTDMCGTKWLYVQVTLKGITYAGFCSIAYLKK